MSDLSFLLHPPPIQTERQMSDLSFVLHPPPFVARGASFPILLNGGIPQTSLPITVLRSTRQDETKWKQQRSSGEEGLDIESKILSAHREKMRSGHVELLHEEDIRFGVDPSDGSGGGRDVVVVDASGKVMVKLAVCVGEEEEALVVVVGGIRSRPFTLCASWLVRRDAEHPWGDEWYKDAGSKTKLMEFSVEMMSMEVVPRGQRISVSRNENFLAAFHPVNRSIPLSATLYYEDGVEADRGRLLHISEPSPFALREDDSKTKIGFRINEVSKNHGSRRFVLVVDGGVNTVPVASKPVKILSKVNKLAASSASCNVNAAPMDDDGSNGQRRKKLRNGPIASHETTTTDGGATIATTEGQPSNVDEWRRQLDAVTCELRENSVHRNLLETKLWNLLSSEFVQDRSVPGFVFRNQAPSPMSRFQPTLTGMIEPPGASFQREYSLLPESGKVQFVVSRFVDGAGMELKKPATFYSGVGLPLFDALGKCVAVYRVDARGVGAKNLNVDKLVSREGRDFLERRWRDDPMPFRNIANYANELTCCEAAVNEAKAALL